MGKLQAGASLVRARVSVSVVSPGATVQYILPAALVQHVHIVLGAQLDSIGFNRFINEYQFVADQKSLGVTKVFAEQQTISGTTYVTFTKGLTESLHQSEVRRFSMAKALTESLHATDDFMGVANLDDDETMVFGKRLTDAKTVSDVRTNAFTKRPTDSVHPADVETFSMGKALADTPDVSDVQTMAVQKNLVDSVDAGDEFNASAITDDGEIMVFGKTTWDDLTQTDSVSVQPEKAFTEAQTTADQIDYFDIGKGIEDVPVTSEALGFDTSKPFEDFTETADAVSNTAGKKFSDRVMYGDGPNAYNTYALSYFGEEYALEGFPALGFSKLLTDTVHSTDDFYGVANADDDETMQFGKGLADLVLNSDILSFSYTKPLADLISKSDLTTVALGKSLADAVGKSDASTKAMDKALTDSKSTSDAVVNGIGKGISDVSATAEYNNFAIQKILSDSVITTDDFLGNANADDDETMLFGKAISDSFNKSDLTGKTAGKGLADTASTSESGSIVWTDYWPIGYTDTTSSVYVGNRNTF